MNAKPKKPWYPTKAAWARAQAEECRAAANDARYDRRHGDTWRSRSRAAGAVRDIMSREDHWLRLAAMFEAKGE